MEVQDKTPNGIRGIISMDITDINGNLIEHIKLENLITYGGLGMLTSFMLTGGYERSGGINKLGFGTNATVANQSDTALTDVVYVNVVPDLSGLGDSYIARWAFELGFTQGNGKTLNEMGLLNFTSPDSNRLFTRRALNAPIVKTSNLKITGYYTIVL
jgi:hypothetical protein